MGDETLLDLLRRLPHRNVLRNLVTLQELLPGQHRRLCSLVDQPLGIAYDEQANREFVCCIYNKEGSSYRFVL